MATKGQTALLGAAALALTVVAISLHTNPSSKDPLPSELDLVRAELVLEIPLARGRTAERQLKLLKWLERVPERKVGTAFHGAPPADVRGRLRDLADRMERLGVRATLNPSATPASVRRRPLRRRFEDG